MISFPFIKVDANVDMEVFITLEVFARLNMATVAAAAAAAAATLRAALILFCLLRIFMPISKTLCKSFIRQMSSSSWSESGISILFFQSAISNVIGVDNAFASTSIHDELFQLHLQFLDQFLLFNTHGESELSCDYNEIMRRYCQCIAVRWEGRATSIQGIEGGSLLQKEDK